MRRSNYNKFPVVSVADHDSDCVNGWREIGERLRAEVARHKGPSVVVAVETYPGVRDDQVLPALRQALRPSLIIDSRQAMRSAEDVDRLIANDLTDDPVFGRISQLEISAFFDPARLSGFFSIWSQGGLPGTTLVYGVGATLIAPHFAILVYADMARWELQQRQRRGEIGNLAADNRSASPSQKYKRAYFIDWRVCDRLKQRLFDRVDFFLDTHQSQNPKLATGTAVRAGLKHVASRPFRVVPFFDPGPWGGQWMKEVCDLDRSAPNFAWCFDCVPEENSLLLDFGGRRIELPSIDLVFQQPRELLGDAVYKRFGAEFPIRFDFLDTMGGGNLSLQVHPLTEYIRKNFGMSYTQDESYYLLDAAPGASVFLGFKDDVVPEEFMAALRSAQAGGAPLDAEKFVNRIPAKRHDHFLIPAGTIHCSGKDSMVLEISATPYIFTFKLWDWGRMGLDGEPRPIHIEHGRHNLQYSRNTRWVESNLINRIEPIRQGVGWREERTGLHELEFLETRRVWFSDRVPRHTNGTVRVLNLAQGEEAIVESPTHAFEPFVIHYAETLIVPAAVGSYTIRPFGLSVGQECATIEAFVRDSGSSA